MFPPESIAADGSGSSRNPPAAWRALTAATTTGAFQVAPPSLERKESISAEPSDQNGTTTVPFGWTNCSPASPWVESGGVVTGLTSGVHVAPRSVKGLTR